MIEPGKTNRTGRPAKALAPRQAWILGALALGALGCSKAPIDPDLAATYDGGSLSVSEVETFLRGEARSGASSSAGGWIDRYRRGAQALAVERWILADQPDGETLRTELGQDFIRLSCDVTAEVFAASKRDERDTPAIDEDTLRTLYEEKAEVFDQPERRLAWHIFKRHRDSSDKDDTVAFLQSLRARAQGAESFRQLARAHSDSENRTLGGHIGWVERGRLPPALDRVVFDLPSDGTSEPIINEHGGVLLFVSDIVPAVSVSFDEARPKLVQRLREVARQETMAALAQRAPTSDQDLILDQEELLHRFQQPVAEPLVMRVGEAELSLQTLREMLEPVLANGIRLVPVVDRLAELYRSQVDRHLVCRLAETEDFLESAGQDRIEQRVRRLALARLVDRRLEMRIRTQIDRQPDALRSFYQDNEHLYQSPLQLLVGGLITPVGSDPEARLLAFEQLRAELQSGAITVEQASERPGVEVLEPSWMGPAGLALLEPKIRLYLTKLNGPGFTAPFRQSGTLQLLQVVERREPSPLTYAEVSDRVRESFFERRQQQLFGQVVDEILDEARFVFHAAGIERHLGDLGLASAAGSGGP